MRGEVLQRGRGIVQEAQRDPAGSELLLGLVDVLVGQGRVTRDRIGRAVVAGVEQLARDQPPLDPPLIEIAEL